MDSSNGMSEIFNSICEIMVDEDFVIGQTDFYIKNCKVFDDEDENKHEYMKIFEEYVYIIDQAIEAKLSNKYDEDQVN